MILRLRLAPGSAESRGLDSPALPSQNQPPRTVRRRRPDPRRAGAGARRGEDRGRPRSLCLKLSSDSLQRRSVRAGARWSWARPRQPGLSPRGTELSRAADHARSPARSPGQALRRCFSNSDSSSRNSNQQVCGGVQGRLEVAASRSAASALILPPPPLLPPPPGSNLTLARALYPAKPPGTSRPLAQPKMAQQSARARPGIRSSTRSRPISVRLRRKGAGATDCSAS